MFNFAAHSYVLSRGVQGEVLFWGNADRTTTVNLTATNSYGISSTEVQSIVGAAVAEWTSNSDQVIQVTNFTQTLRDDRNDLVFSSDPLIFSGSGVLGITQVSYRSGSGEITEADIFINNNLAGSQAITSDPASDFYLGNIVTHELGHFLGLSHSQTHGSTMFYLVAKGQHTLSSDDLAGMFHLYPGNELKGLISGKVIGGSLLVPVLGSVVEAISETNLEVSGSAITDEDGNFEIRGLDLDEAYYLYISPPRAISTLPSYFHESRTDFCAGGGRYVGSYFQSCLSRDKGKPQTIALSTTSRNRDVGLITIRCGLDLPSGYLSMKGSTYDIDMSTTEGIGESIVGHFTESELNGAGDIFSVDLTSESFANNEYLQIKLTYQRLFTPMKLELTVTRGDGQVSNFPLAGELNSDGVKVDNDGAPVIDITARVPLSLVSTTNTFTLEVRPESLSDYLSGLPGYDEEDIFPGHSLFIDDRGKYQMTLSIVEKLGDDYFNTERKENPTIRDNRSCPDASETYEVRPFVTLENTSNTQTITADDSPKAISCGAVDYDNRGGPRGGLGSLLLGFCLILLSSNWKRSCDP